MASGAVAPATASSWCFFSFFAGWHGSHRTHPHAPHEQQLLHPPQTHDHPNTRLKRCCLLLYNTCCAPWCADCCCCRPPEGRLQQQYLQLPASHTSHTRALSPLSRQTHASWRAGWLQARARAACRAMLFRGGRRIESVKRAQKHALSQTSKQAAYCPVRCETAPARNANVV